ncbi:amidohydrolase family protein [Catellatospora bangladeshensis]|uniref:amidohydrolase family protein n=1 Tax=Catellatospora bangladeshensis TaxID=310355 RepID=UPI00360CE3AD
MNLDPIATIIDAHLHVWDPSRGVYPWLGEHLAPVNRAMTLREVMPELTDRGVGAVVLVQSADAGFDTDLMFETARSHPEVAGVVGWVPLDLPAEAAGRLAWLRDEPLFAGVRNLIHERADPDWILRPDVDAGLGLLEQAEVPFDFVAGGPQALATAAEVARRHPGLHLILDHLGAPRWTPTPARRSSGCTIWRCSPVTPVCTPSCPGCTWGPTPRAIACAEPVPTSARRCGCSAPTG